MRRSGIVLCSCLLLPAFALAPGAIQPHQGPRNPAPDCEDFQVNSSLAGAELSVEIALPEGYDRSSAREYGSIYVLDANYFFDDRPGTLEDFLERGEGLTKILHRLTANGTVPPSTLIGIGYSEEDRTRLSLMDVDAFLGFFTDELIPAVETRCPVRHSGEERVLFGYSASAHFSTYVLLHDADTGTDTFHGVISISGLYEPSGAAYQLEERLFQEVGSGALAGRQLFLAVGQDDPKTDLLAAHRAFAARLAGRRYSDLRLATLEYAGRGHYDIPEFAFEQGLIWMFSN